MPPTLNLIQYPGLTRGTTLSAPCAKVHMALAFKGLAYTVHNVRSPLEARRHNPRGRVPVLEIDGERVVDSSDILDALEKRFPEPPLEAADSGDRAVGKILEDWADEVLYFHAVGLRWCDDDNFGRMHRLVLSRLPVPLRWFIPALARRELRRRARGQGVGLKDVATIRRELSGCLDALVTLVSGDGFLAGPVFGRGDLAVAAVLDQLRLAELTPDAARLIEQRAPLVAWLHRVHEKVPDIARPPAH